jgi:hypothetical protein
LDKYGEGFQMEKMLTMARRQKWYLLQLDGKHKGVDKTEDAKETITKLLQHQSCENALLISHLKETDVMLRTADAKWLKTFVENKGPEILLSIFFSHHTPKTMTPEDMEIVNHCVQNIRHMIKSKEGLASFVRVPYALRELTMALDSSSEAAKNDIMFILTAIGSIVDREDMFQYV